MGVGENCHASSARCEGDPGKAPTSLGDRAEVSQAPVIIYQHGSFGRFSSGLHDKEHFTVYSWARLVRLRFVLPMFYNCPGICRQRLLINVAVILSVTFRSNSLSPKWVIIYFRADFNLSWSLCLPDPVNGRFIALRWYFPALVQNWALLRQGKARLFLGSQSWCLSEAPVLGCYMLPLWGSSAASFFFPFLFLFFSLSLLLSHPFHGALCTIFPSSSPTLGVPRNSNSPSPFVHL